MPVLLSLPSAFSEFIKVLNMSSSPSKFSTAPNNKAGPEVNSSPMIENTPRMDPRPKREIKQPRHLIDYVTNLEASEKDPEY
ncbi:hypothetical protein P8452_34678 [Trifolium repens]|nr:hypothetical protein P8452_34678 [Trifolium repens]